MRTSYTTQLITGLFIIGGFIAFAYISMNLGNLSLFGRDGYRIHASFADIGGLKNGAPVEIAGVKIGEVEKIKLVEGRARVDMHINKGVEIESDSLASIRTKGLIGEKYIKITLGAMMTYLQPGEEIVDTEPALDIEELIGKFIYNSDSEESETE